MLSSHTPSHKWSSGRSYECCVVYVCTSIIESITLFSLMYTTLFCGADVDECIEDDTLCKEGTYCFNTPGSYKCYSELCLLACDPHVTASDGHVITSDGHVTASDGHVTASDGHVTAM